MAARRSPGFLVLAAAAALGGAPAVARDVALKDQVAVFCVGCQLASIEREAPGGTSQAAVDASGQTKVALRPGGDVPAVSWAVVAVGRDDGDTLVIKDLARRTEGSDHPLRAMWHVPLAPASGFWGAGFGVLVGDARVEARRLKAALGEPVAETSVWAVRVEEHMRDAWRWFAPRAEVIVSEAADVAAGCRHTHCAADAVSSTAKKLKLVWQKTCEFFARPSRLYVLVFGHGFAPRAKHDVQYRWGTGDGLDRWRPSAGSPSGGYGGWWAGTSMGHDRGRGTLRVKVDGVEFNRRVDMTGDGDARCVGGGEEGGSGGHGSLFVAAFHSKQQYDAFQHAVAEDAASTWIPGRAAAAGVAEIPAAWGHQALVDLCQENVETLIEPRRRSRTDSLVSDESESGGGTPSIQVTKPAADADDQSLLLLVGMALGCLLVCMGILACLWRRRPSADVSIADEDSSDQGPSISWRCELAGPDQLLQAECPSPPALQGYYQRDLSLGSVLAALLGEGALGVHPAVASSRSPSCASLGECTSSRDLDVPDAEEAY